MDTCNSQDYYYKIFDICIYFAHQSDQHSTGHAMHQCLATLYNFMTIESVCHRMDTINS